MISARLAVAFWAACLLSLSLTGRLAAAQSLTAAPLNTDVRVLVDVSGSMKKNDPHNLRRPAVDLLVKLLPDGSHAGLWLFGNQTQPLTPYTEVDDAWQGFAAASANRINSSDMFTDIGGALEAAAAAGPPRPGYRTSLILLTDGVVDIDKNAAVNQQEWRRIVNDLLPQLQEAGFVVHTIALSENTDRELLEKLSVATGGVAAVARTADELMPIFLKIFDAAAPAERLPLHGNSFFTDPTIEEFTALIFRERGSEGAQLRTPRGDVLSYENRGGRLNWYRTENYDLITMAQPQAGEWQIIADMAQDSRVTVVSNLRLRLRDLPANVYQGQRIPLSFALWENEAVVNRREFLSLMTFELELQRDVRDHKPQTVWHTAVPANDPPASGIFHAQLPKFEEAGGYRLVVRVDGKSFQRELSHSFVARMPFSADVVAEEGADEEVLYRLMLRSLSADIDPKRTQVVATVFNPDGRKLVRPMPYSDMGDWQLPFSPSATGRYRIRMTVSGTDRAGIKFDSALDDLALYYSPERGLIYESDEGPILVEPPVTEPAESGVSADSEADAEPSAQQAQLASRPADSPEEVHRITEESPPERSDEPKEDEATPEKTEEAASAEPQKASWGVYSSFALGNLLLVALGYWGYRAIRGNEQNADEILEQFSSANIASVTAGKQTKDQAIAPIESEPLPGGLGDQEEPEMEGLNDADVSDADTVATVDTTGGESNGADAPLAGVQAADDDTDLDAALANILGEMDADESEDWDADEDNFGLSEEAGEESDEDDLR